ncbi:MAG TPA: DUF4382 domain-containing protein [Albitalea sp.]|nr:DUF4382 domain-containing protein [Albitalea sp.]
MKNLRLLLPLAVLTASVLVACGGGGSSMPAATPQSVHLRTFITDNLAQDYAQVWVQVQKIEAVDASGARVVLYDGAAAGAPATVDLSQLASVGQLLSQTSVPVATYRRIDVTLADTVTLVPRDGSPALHASLGGHGSPVTIPVELELDTGIASSLLLDFDLARFVYDPATNSVLPVVTRRAEGDVDKFLRNQAELHATVVSVGADSLVVDDRHLGAGITVQLAVDAVIFDESTHRAVALSTLAAGTRIEAHGVLQPKAQPTDPTVVRTALVRIDSSAQQGDATAQAEGGGVVTAVNTSAANGVTTTLLTVELHDADFMPGAGTITVDASQAVFSHGTLADLAAGVAIEFHGTRDASGNVVASRIEVEGASSQDEQERHPDNSFVSAHGTVQSTSATGFVLQVAAGEEHLAAGSYSVDTSGALFTSGHASCLVAGEAVEVKGSLDAAAQPTAAITATEVEIEGGCPAQ